LFQVMTGGSSVRLRQERDPHGALWVKGSHEFGFVAIVESLCMLERIDLNRATDRGFCETGLERRLCPPVVLGAPFSGCFVD
jgi:hypothetical protein